jgi:hypothetical protein
MISAPREDPTSRTSRAKLTRSGLGVWLTLLCFSLLGYAMFGRGWAHIGAPPIFIGEVILFWGLVATILFGKLRGMFDVPGVWLLVLLQAWGLCRTVPYLSQHGADALRDAVIWGYSAFAFMVFGAIRAQPRRLAALVPCYHRFFVIFLLFMPLVWFTARIYPRPVIPHWPWANVPAIAPKAGDVLVHAAGILAFWVAGLGGLVGPVWVLLLSCSLVLVGSFDRAGALSFLAVFAVCFLLRPRDRSLWQLTAMAICGLVLFAVTEVRVPMPGRDREVSFAQVVANLTSTVSASTTGDLDGTKQWRLEWWSDILRYTVYGKYCWDGKGFGINLADDDGYQVDEDASLRDPHNGHLTMLARAGVPGFLLWSLVQLSWACGLLRGYLRSQRAGQRRWTGLFQFLLLYWMAFMINASFDVFLEGPMGGIWFWTLYGVGLAAMWVYRNHPEVLDGAFPGRQSA